MNRRCAERACILYTVGSCILYTVFEETKEKTNTRKQAVRNATSFSVQYYLLLYLIPSVPLAYFTTFYLEKGLAHAPQRQEL